MAKKGNQKKPAQKITPPSQRLPRGIKKAEKTINSYLIWNFNSIDVGGKWSWKYIDPKIWFEHVCPAKEKFSKMKWSEIIGKESHVINVEKIIPEARKRLSKIKQEDVDSLFSLRIGSTRRIWGIKHGNIFKTLWWDPNHEIYPTEKPNT